MCLGAIYWARIGKVYYAGDRNDAAEAGFDDRNFYEQMESGRVPEGLSLVQIGREKALKAFRVWNEKADKVPY